MAEPAGKETALAPLRLAARKTAATTEVSLGECPLRGRINLRGDAADPTFLAAVARAAGAEPPVTPNTTSRHGGATLLWLGPDEWLIETPAESEIATAAALEGELAALHAAVTTMFEGWRR